MTDRFNTERITSEGCKMTELFVNDGWAMPETRVVQNRQDFRDESRLLFVALGDHSGRQRRGKK